jgi:serine/threonine-protein kinase
VVAGDVLFIGSCNGIVRALDRSTGRVRWATAVAPDSNKYFFHGNPYITPDLLVIGADPATGGVHAFERSTGRQRWKHSAGAGVSGPLSGLGRLVYAIQGDDHLLALDIESGAVTWTFPIEVWGWLGPAAAAGRVFAGAKDGSVYGLNAETGRVEWRTGLGSPVSTSVTATADALYAGAADGRIVRLDPRRGTIQASLKLDGALKPRDAPVAAGDTLLVLLSDEAEDYRALVAVDAKLGSVRWRQSVRQPWSTSRVFVWQGAAVLGSGSGEVTAYCLADGRPAWSRTVRGSVRAIGGADDALYVSTTEGSVYALGRINGCGAK